MELFNKFFLRIIALFAVVLIFLFAERSAAAREPPAESNWIVQIALEEGVHPQLVYAVMNQESDFRAQAVSDKGAIGLMQLLPGTAARFNVNPYIPQENVRGGCRYLRYLSILFRYRLDLVLAGYNAGEAAVIKYNYKVPPYEETRNYVARILNSPYLQAATTSIVVARSSRRLGVARVSPSSPVNPAPAALLRVVPATKKPPPPPPPPPAHSGFLFH